MKHRLTWFLALIVTLIVTVSACSKKVPPPPAPAPPPPPAVPAAPPAPPPPPAAAPAPLSTPPALTEQEVFSRKSVDQLNAEKPLTDAYFDYDKSDLREDGRASLQKDAEYLKKWSSIVVSVEGHSDSRGSSSMQPRSRQPAGNGRERLSCEPRSGREPNHRREQGQGAAVLRRGDRSLAGSKTGEGHFIITAK